MVTAGSQQFFRFEEHFDALASTVPPVVSDSAPHVQRLFDGARKGSSRLLLNGMQHSVERSTRAQAKAVATCKRSYTHVRRLPSPISSRYYHHSGLKLESSVLDRLAMSVYGDREVSTHGVTESRSHGMFSKVP